MFAPIRSISNTSKKLLFFGAFLFFALCGYGQDVSIENVTEDEDVGTMVFTVTLDIAVAGGTVVPYSFIDDTAIGGIDYNNTIGTPLFFIGDAGETQTITVPIIDDFIDEEDDEDFIVQLGQPTNGVGLAGGGDARGRIRDNDSAGVNVSTTTGTTTEDGEQAIFTFTLTSQPTADVTLFINRYDATETFGPSDIILTPANWNTGVDLIVTGVDDDIIDGDILDNIRTEDVSSLDPFYDGLDGGDVPDLEVTNQDDDVAGVVVTPVIGTTTEAGGTATFTFTLTSEPSREVTIPITGYDITEVTGDDEVVLDSGNWNTGVDLIVTGVDDAVVDGDVILSLITGDITSDDDDYDNLDDTDVAEITVTNTDDDIASLSISDVTVLENVVGGNLIFDVVLDVAVIGGTTVDYTYSDVTATGGGVDYEGTDGTLIFVGTANEIQQITTTIIDDDLFESTDETFSVALGTPSNGVNLVGSGIGTGTITDDDNCAPAPILNTDVQTAFCGTFTYGDDTPLSLNDYTDSTPPSGTVLTWSTLSDPLNENAHLSPAEVASPPNDGSYFGFFYDAANECSSGTIEVELTLNPIPIIAETMGDERCGPGEVILTASGAPDVDQPPTFNWYDSATGNNLIASGQSFSQTISITTSFWVEASADGCVSERQEVVATIYPLPSAGTPSNASACSVAANGPTLVDLDDLLTGEGSGVWTVTTDPSNSLAIGIGNIVSFEGRVAGDYVFTFTTDNATPPFCENVSSEVTISVNDCDTDTDLDGLFDGVEITLGTDPNNADTDGDGIEDGVEVGDDTANPLDEDEDGIIDALDSNILDSDMDGVVDQLDPGNLNPCIPDPNNEFCEATVDLEITKTVNDDYLNVGEQLTFTITVNNISQETASLIRVSEVLDTEGFDYISHFTAPGDGVYDEVAGTWDIPVLDAGESATLVILVEGITFGIYVNTATIVEVSPFDIDPTNNEASVEVEINERSNNECGFLFNQFSPNGDGTNDFLIINCITNTEYVDNSLEIYDRYGNQVFATQGYDNTWDGTRNNTDLPKGTYFYVLDLGDGSEIKKGWIQIIR
jgi:gliding motility-associated-like protein/uncharacterized repeat protein (TIGR01451 family)